MRKSLLLFAIVLLATASFAKNDGWTDLFNGKNLKGWERLNGEAEYTVENGEIVGTSKTGTPNSFLATKKTYSDFILEYEIKMERGLNSGVQIRSLSKKDYKDGRVHGYQVECDDSGRAWTAGIYEEGRRGWLYPLEYNRAAKTAYKNGEWNKVRVEAVGNTIRTWLNGVPAANLVDDMTPEGFIALQVHGIGNNKDKEGKTIRWRNIRIKTENLEADRKETTAPEVSYLLNTLTENQKKEGWVLLFDGKAMDGWRGSYLDNFPEKGWGIQDGLLVVNPNNKKDERGGDIVTEKKYSNFILELDFMLTEGANSGIKYFVQADRHEGGVQSGIGCEYQIIDDKKHPDAAKGASGTHSAASLYDMIPANGTFYDPNLRAKRLNGPGEWNRATIVVDGPKVTHYLNGMKVVEYDRSTQIWRALVQYSKYRTFENFGEFKEGRILLQDHSDRVYFRNIKIKEL